MRSLLFSVMLVGATFSACAQIKLPAPPGSAAQALQGLKNLQGAEAGPSAKEIGQGLKEALDAGVSTGVTQLSQVGGFAQSPIYRIPLPPEIKALEDKVRKNPVLNATVGPKLDGLISAMNE
ncbi:MAG: DUF4197 family protein, partial [Schleiferiaceae bacterium]